MPARSFRDARECVAAQFIQELDAHRLLRAHSRALRGGGQPKLRLSTPGHAIRATSGNQLAASQRPSPDLSGEPSGVMDSSGMMGTWPT
jgi:hypothetical protein